VSATATREEIPCGDSQSTPLSPCASCGNDSPLGSLVVEGPRNHMVITGTVYTCMGDDCCVKGDPSPTPEGARHNWNVEQARIKAERDANFEAMDARLP
jgi:hypothetical protein